MGELLEIRRELDIIDAQIVELFQKRIALNRSVAEYKAERNMQIQDKQREKEKVAAVTAGIEEPFSCHAVKDLFGQIMAIGRRYQYHVLTEMGKEDQIPFEGIDQISMSNIRVVYQGVPGAYSDAALVQFFGQNTVHYNVVTWSDAMAEVSQGRADYAVLPIENSTAGMVADVYDLLMEYNNTIIAETYLKVDHCLLGLPGASIEEIQTVYSHPQGLMQCNHYLDCHKNWQRIGENNTAVSARKVVEMGDRTQAAIASRYAGELCGLTVLDENINDNKKNTTRFIIVSRKKQYRKDAQKISICFEIPHESGSLYNILAHFIFNDLNMTKIESRPIPGRNWEYRFYVDFEGNLSEPAVRNALMGIEKESNHLRILGNY